MNGKKKSKKFEINEEASKLGVLVISNGVQQTFPNQKAALDKDMVLYVKAGPDGTSLGDCPFAQYVQMCLLYKGLKFELQPCSPEKKPSWLLESYEGKMPCLVHRNEAYTDSSLIADYLEFFFPKPELVLEDESHAEAKEEFSSIFPCLARYMKNLDPSAEPGLKQSLLDALKPLDERLATGGPFVCGKQLTQVDFSLAPQLYHLKVCVEEMKGMSFDSFGFSSLSKYMDLMFGLEEFKRSSFPSSTVVWGWNDAIKKSAEAATQMQ